MRISLPLILLYQDIIYLNFAGKIDCYLKSILKLMVKYKWEISQFYHKNFKKLLLKGGNLLMVGLKNSNNLN